MLVILVLASLVSALALKFQAPPKPNPATQFVAKGYGGYHGSKSNFSIFYDESILFSRQDSHSFFYASVAINSTEYIDGKDIYLVINDACRPYPTTLKDFPKMWSFLYKAVYIGTKLVGHRQCDAWEYTSSAENVTLFVNGDIPVSLETVYPSSAGAPSQTLIFTVLQFYSILMYLIVSFSNLIYRNSPRVQFPLRSPRFQINACTHLCPATVHRKIT